MKLLSLLWVFALLSVLAMGGGTAVLPEMQRMTVTQFHWLTDQQFRDIYGLGQVAPGPNMLMVLVIGFKLAGAAGALVVAIGFFLPDCLITFFVNRWWARLKGSPWRAAVQRGLAPVAIGLMASGTWAIARLSIIDLTALLIALAILLVLLWRHVNPALLVLAGGLAYMLLPH